MMYGSMPERCEHPATEHIRRAIVLLTYGKTQDALAELWQALRLLRTEVQA